MDLISDEFVRKAIVTKFASDDRVAFIPLRVGVSNGIVHLAGIAPSPDVRIVAAEIAMQVSGVREVVNRIDAPGVPNPARTINLNLQHEEGENEQNSQ